MFRVSFWYCSIVVRVRVRTFDWRTAGHGMICQHLRRSTTLWRQPIVVINSVWFFCLLLLLLYGSNATTAPSIIMLLAVRSQLMTFYTSLLLWEEVFAFFNCSVVMNIRAAYFCLIASNTYTYYRRRGPLLLPPLNTAHCQHRSSSSTSLEEYEFVLITNFDLLGHQLIAYQRISVFCQAPSIPKRFQGRKTAVKFLKRTLLVLTW